MPKIKYDIRNYLDYLKNEVREAEKLPNFKLRLNQTATLSWLKEQKYDTLVCAYGTKNVTPRFEGIDSVKTVQAVELLVKPELASGAKKSPLSAAELSAAKPLIGSHTNSEKTFPLWKCCRI